MDYDDISEGSDPVTKLEEKGMDTECSTAATACKVVLEQ